jgi:DNA replication initiation complex subunit (GINS family)
VDAQQQRRLRPDCPLVVRGARAVRRPDLHEARARASEDVRDPEAVADLDQLAAGDDDLASFAERREREEDGGRVVVDDERRLGAGQLPEESGEVVLPRTARALLKVVFEVRVAAGDLDDALESLRGERGSSEVRVHDDAGGVQNAAKLWCEEGV